MAPKKEDAVLPSKEMSSDHLIVGQFASSYGIQGWSKVNSYTDPMENMLSYKRLYIEVNGEWVKADIESSARHGKQLLLKLKECDTPEKAKTYTGTHIAITRDQLAPLNEGEYYFSDLEACRVKNLDGQEFGAVDYVLETGANPVLVVKGERERMIPFVVDEYVTNVDLENNVITVDWDAEF